MHLSSHSAGPSRKRCRSPVDSAPLSMLVTGSLAPTRADLLPPRKRFRDSYSFEASIEEDAEVVLIGTGVDMELEEYEADASAGDTAEVGINPMTAPLVEEEIVEPAGEDSPDSSGTRDGIVKSVEDTPVDLGDAVHDFYHHMSEVRIDRIVRIETAQRRLEADQLIASGDRARMAEMIYSLRLENLKVRAMLDIKKDRVSSLRLHMSLSREEFCQIRRDRDDARGRLKRLESYLGRNFGIGDRDEVGDRVGLTIKGCQHDTDEYEATPALEILLRQGRLEGRSDEEASGDKWLRMAEAINSMRLRTSIFELFGDIERESVSSLRHHMFPFQQESFDRFVGIEMMQRADQEVGDNLGRRFGFRP
ncbi:hypothetical protein Tco_1237921 [Tanacetum coccineum]